MHSPRAENAPLFFFNLGGKAHELGVKEIAYYLWQRYGSTHRVRFLTVPFGDGKNEILQKLILLYGRYFKTQNDAGSQRHRQAMQALQLWLPERL